MNPVAIFLIVLAFALFLIAWEWITCHHRQEDERRRPLRPGERINGQRIELVSHSPFTAYLVNGEWVDREGKPIE